MWRYFWPENMLSNLISAAQLGKDLEFFIRRCIEPKRSIEIRARALEIDGPLNYLHIFSKLYRGDHMGPVHKWYCTTVFVYLCIHVNIFGLSSALKIDGPVNYLQIFSKLYRGDHISPVHKWYCTSVFVYLCICMRAYIRLFKCNRNWGPRQLVGTGT